MDNSRENVIGRVTYGCIYIYRLYRDIGRNNGESSGKEAKKSIER